MARESLHHGAQCCGCRMGVEIGAGLSISLEMTDGRSDALDVCRAKSREHTSERLISRGRLLHHLE
jgi:hypothetical protein